MSWFLGILLWAIVLVSVAWAGLLLLSLLFSIICLRLQAESEGGQLEDLCTLDGAIAECRDTGLTGWPLVESAQRLVALHVAEYGYCNSFDSPGRAFERGRGYCWQRAAAPKRILEELDVTVEMVHAFLNRFPDRTVAGRRVRGIVAGHVWLRVRITDDVKDVCPGDPNNLPGAVHFRSRRSSPTAQRKSPG